MVHFIAYFGAITIYILVGYILPLILPRVKVYVKSQLEMKDYERNTIMQLTHIFYIAFGLVGLVGLVLGGFNISGMIGLYVVGSVLIISGLLYASYIEDLTTWYKSLL